MKKHISILSTVFSILVLSSFQNIGDDKIIGNWYAEDLSKSTIKFYKSADGMYYGKIIQSNDKEKIGQTPFQKYKYDEKTKSYLGLIKPASLFFDLNGKISFLDINTIQVTGSKGFLVKTYVFKRK